MRFSFLLLPFMGGCMHLSAISSPAPGEFYVLAHRPPFARGYVMHCTDVKEGDSITTQCIRVTDFKQARLLVPSSPDKPIDTAKAKIE